MCWCCLSEKGCHRLSGTHPVACENGVFVLRTWEPEATPSLEFSRRGAPWKGRAHITEVPKCTNRFHRRVKSASTTTCSYLKNLEHLIPRHSPFADGLRREHHRLCKLHGNRGILPLFRGGKLHNCYLRRASGRESGHCDEYTSSSSGNFRQAPKL